MGPDVTKELDDQLRVLADLISQQTAALTGMAASMNQISGIASRNNSSLKSLGNAQQKDSNSRTQNNIGTTKLQQTTNKYREVTEEAIAGLVAAADTGKGAMMNFGRTVLSTQEGFAKYNSTIGQVGDAALQLGKVFGILGTAVGGIVKLFTNVLQYQTQQADSIFKAYDNVAKMGAAGTITSKEITEMGRNAGLTSLELDKLIEPMKTVRGGFVGLGGTTSEGIKKFGEMTAVNESVRREFKRLGMGDQERNQMMADFTSLMNQSGTSFSVVEHTQGGLQQAALNYARQMYVLADVSGMTVDEAKQKYEMQMATLETALFENKLKQDLIAAQEEYDKATTQEERDRAAKKLEKVKKEEAGYKALNEALMQAGVGQELIVGAQKQYLSGVINDSSVQLAQWGINLDDMIAKAKEGTLNSGDMAQEVKEGFRKTLKNYGPANVALDPQSAKNMGLANQEMIKRSTQQATTDYRDTLKKAVDKIAGNKDGTGVAATDPAQEARNNLVESERWLKLKIDSLAEQFNPFLGNMGLIKMFGTAALGAVAVLGTIAAFKLVTGGVKGGLGLFNKPTEGLKSTLGSSPLPIANTSTVSNIGGNIKETEMVTGGAAKAEDKAIKGIQLASEPKSSTAARMLLAASTGLAGMGATVVPMIVGATKVSAAIAIISGAIGLIGALVSKTTIPYIVKGVSSFDKLDGPKLESIGIAMAGLGAAFAVASGGKMLSALSFFTDMDKDTPLEKIGKDTLELQNLDVNKDRLATNTSLLVMFSNNMFAERKAAASMASKDVIKSISEGVINYFKGTPPFEQLKAFSNLKVNTKAVKKNATSFKLFADAIASFKGTGSTLGSIGAIFAEATSKFFEVNPPVDQALYFSYLDINDKKTKNNAESFRMFSEAMSTYKGYGTGLGAISSTIADAAFKFFVVKPPVAEFAVFSNLNIDGKKVESDSKAFLNFATAMASYTPGPGLLDSISNLITGASSYFNKGGPVYKFEEFAKMNFMKKKKNGGGAELDQGLLAQYASSIGTEAFVGESPLAEPIDSAIETGKEAAKSFWGAITDAAGAVVDAATLKLKPNNIALSNTTDLSGMNKIMLGRFFLAAKDFGKPITINSAYRPDSYQAQLWVRGRILGEKGIHTPARPKNTTTITYKGRQYTVEGSGKGSKHGRGEALDITTSREAFDPYLSKYGLHRPFKQKDPPHVELKAREGGVFTGPGSGYPVELHGHEVVVPINPDSLLMKLSQITADSVEATKIENVLSGKQSVNGNFELYNRIVSQLDQVFWMIDSTHDYDKKMLKEEHF